MKRLSSLILLIFFTFSLSVSADPPLGKIRYAEQFYLIYHRHLHMYNDDINAQMVYLEWALASEFVNPLYALATIETEDEWEHYKNLFRMHCHMELVRMNRLMAARHDKKKAYFFNKAFKDRNLKNLKIAREYYNFCLYYWDQAIKWADKVSEKRYNFPKIQSWHDEQYMIISGELDYKRIIERDLKRVEKVIADFEAM